MSERGITRAALKTLGVIAQSSLAEEFYLGGGTAAAIQIGHRLSDDLDYFSPNPFSGADCIKRLEAERIPASKLDPAEGTLHCTKAGTRVTFLHYEYPLLESTRRFKGADLASLLDIALMKITAIASRGLRKDFIDLSFILHELPLQHVLGSFSRKFPLEKLDPYHYLRSLTYFDDAEKDPMPRMLVACDWEEVKAFLEKAIRTVDLRDLG